MSTQQTGVEMIAAERQRQIDVEGYSTAVDQVENSRDDLARAGACYALPEADRDYTMASAHIPSVPRGWPWASRYWKPTPDDRVRELVKAGALIAAEIDRLNAEAAR